jgi:hypothetical protein
MVSLEKNGYRHGNISVETVTVDEKKRVHLKGFEKACETDCNTNRAFESQLYTHIKLKNP